jgi:hypothetical protein
VAVQFGERHSLRTCVDNSITLSQSQVGAAVGVLDGVNRIVSDLADNPELGRHPNVRKLTLLEALDFGTCQWVRSLKTDS